jgi:hypothetical protein
VQGETIVCLATRRWDSLWRSTQQIVSRLARQNRVLFFEPGRNPDKPILAEMRRNLRYSFALDIQQAQESLFVIPTPPSLPHARRYLPESVLEVYMPLVIRLNAWILLGHVQRVMKAMDITDPILWLYSPYQVDLVGKLGEKRACYYNYDEFADMAPNARVRDLLRQLDHRLTNRVDVVFASSRAQWERRKNLNPNTYFVPNAVDFDLFHRALSVDTPQPKDISLIPRPIIGFIGWMGYQMDVELLRRVAESCPDCSLVLIGPDKLPDTKDRQALKTLPNVFFLGEKELNELPNYLKTFDVALIPYLLSGHGSSLYPLKLHEYLAAGRDIVATALPSLLSYSHVVRIAETQVNFMHQIREALHDHSAEAIEVRVAVARENTWDQRVLEINRILDLRLYSAEA